MRFKAGLLLVFFWAASLHAQSPEALAAVRSSDLTPHFEAPSGKQLFYVDGWPWIVLAVEIPWLQTTYGRSRETMGNYDYLYGTARKMYLNAVKVPVKWSQVEPQKGVFDFSYVDHVKALAEQNGLKVVLGWFGHYASGHAGNIYRNLTNEVWAPMDIIENDHAYPRAVDGEGVSHHNAISYDYDGVIEREIAAFRALMRHIREVDQEKHTILMVQVENEIAVFDGGDSTNPTFWRDHSPRSNLLFTSGGFHDDLKFSAARLASNWLRRVTEAGGKEYPIPFYVDFVGGKLAPWMVGGSPGEDVATYLNNCPFLTFAAMNLYVFRESTVEELRQRIEEYRVSRNLTAISETNSDRSAVAPRLAFLAIGEYAAPLFSPWALNISFPTWGEPYVLRDGQLANGAPDLARAYTAIKDATLPIALYSGTKELRVFLSRAGEETAEVGGTKVTVSNGPDGQAMVIHAEPGEFLVIGWRTVATLSTPIVRWPELKKVRVEAGRWDRERWVQDPRAIFMAIAEHASGVFRVRLFDDPTVVRLSWK